MSYHTIADMPNSVRKFQSFALLASVLLVGSNAFLLSPILSEVAEGLGTDTIRVAWAISAFGASTAISALTLASIIDRMALGQVLAGAALLLALAQALSGLSQGWLWLCMSQAMAGIAVGILLPGTYATAAATAPPGREAAQLGFVLTGWALSLVVAVPLAALVAEHAGWRAVYTLLSAMSGLVALWLALAFRGLPSQVRQRTPPWHAFRLPGVAPLLVIMFTFMTAFYGTFAFLGEGMRQAFDLSTQGAGAFAMAYGLGFGFAGLGLGLRTKGFRHINLALVMLGIAASYAGWHIALVTPPLAFLAAMIWGVLNQLGLSTLVVSLNHRGGDARGAVMGLNTGVTYTAVFAGPAIMGPIYAGFGFTAVGTAAASIVLVGAAVSWKKTRS